MGVSALVMERPVSVITLWKGEVETVFIVSGVCVFVYEMRLFCC